MNRRLVLLLPAAFCSLFLLLPSAYADNSPNTPPKDQFYTNAGALLGTMNTTSTTFTMVGMDGSLGLDHLSAGSQGFLQHLFVAGSMLTGADSGSTIIIGAMNAGIGAHYEFEPTTHNVDIGKISAFALLLEQYTSISVTMPTYTIGGTTYGGGTSTYTDTSSAIEYGVKWMILNAYEWDFYGINSSSGSTSGTTSAPVGGDSLNLQFKWIMEPQANSPYLGMFYSSQSQNGSSSDTVMVIGGYIW